MAAGAYHHQHQGSPKISFNPSLSDGTAPSNVSPRAPAAGGGAGVPFDSRSPALASRTPTALDGSGLRAGGAQGDEGNAVAAPVTDGPLSFDSQEEDGSLSGLQVGGYGPADVPDGGEAARSGASAAALAALDREEDELVAAEALSHTDGTGSAATGASNSSLLASPQKGHGAAEAAGSAPAPSTSFASPATGSRPGSSLSTNAASASASRGRARSMSGHQQSRDTGFSPGRAELTAQLIAENEVLRQTIADLQKTIGTLNSQLVSVTVELHAASSARDMLARRLQALGAAEHGITSRPAHAATAGSTGT